MGVTTLTAAAAAGAAAAVGYAAGYMTARPEKEAKSLREEGFYLAKGGWKKKKESATTEVVEGNATKGAALFKAKCATCHSCIPGGPTKQGPNLYGIMGKEAGKSSGFKFTKNILAAGIVWDDEVMSKWLENPKEMVKGTSMAFPGFKKETDRADVVAYLKTLDDNAPPPEKKKH